MPLGTKNRMLRDATLCREHLRQRHKDMLALVNEFIAEIEGDMGDAAWSQFTDLKRDEREMLHRTGDAFQRWLKP